LKILDDLKKKGKVIIGYGASGRGTTVMNFCGIDGRYLDYVVDDAPAKHGFYTPGTHVKILPWEATKQGAFPEYSLLFAWSFINEVKKRREDYLKQGGKFIVPLPEVSIVSE
jgi:methylation protein EvaC